MQSYEKYDEKDHSNIDINNYSTFPYSVVTVHVTELIIVSESDTTRAITHKKRREACFRKMTEVKNAKTLTKVTL